MPSCFGSFTKVIRLASAATSSDFSEYIKPNLKSVNTINPVYNEINVGRRQAGGENQNGSGRPRFLRLDGDRPFYNGSRFGIISIRLIIFYGPLISKHLY